MPIHWKAALAAPLLLSAAPADNPRINSGMPPERFQGEAVAVTLFVNDVTQFCGKPPEGYRILACQKEVRGVDYIVLPNPCPLGDVEFFAKLACHEIAHARGWPGIHGE